MMGEADSSLKRDPNTDCEFRLVQNVYKRRDLPFNKDFYVQEITKEIYIGPYPVLGSDFDLLRETSIRSAVCLLSDDELNMNHLEAAFYKKMFNKQGIALSFNPFNLLWSQNIITTSARKTRKKVRKFINRYESVYVFSASGIDRPPKIIASYFYEYHPEEFQAILSSMKSKLIKFDVENIIYNLETDAKNFDNIPGTKHHSSLIDDSESSSSDDEIFKYQKKSMVSGQDRKLSQIFEEEDLSEGNGKLAKGSGVFSSSGNLRDWSRHSHSSGAEVHRSKNSADRKIFRAKDVDANGIVELDEIFGEDSSQKSGDRHSSGEDKGEKCAFNASQFKNLNPMTTIQSSEIESEINEGDEEDHSNYGWKGEEDMPVRKNSAEDIAHTPSENDYNYFSPSFQTNLMADRTLIDRNVRNYAH